MKDEKMKSLIG